ncbi:MAG TPA: SgcJ/EcaC family oxidoreductase [Gemmatimonadaceae bacterium]|nr:SgcJ/EcaC family oxidoreductase [Gemmatimonadaceae bacterium]
MSPDERAIRDVISTWLSASAAGDNEKVLTLMSDDVIFLVAGRSFGKEEFSAGQNALATHRIEASSDVREVVVSGDLAYARTDLTVTMTPLAGGEALRRSGPTLSIFRREQGRWVLIRDANLLARG